MFTKKKKPSAKAEFEKFLKAYNCAYTTHEEENSTVFDFEFQAGRFGAAIRKQDDCIEITYPTIDQQPISLSQFQSWMVAKERKGLCDSLNRWHNQIKLDTAAYLGLQRRYFGGTFPTLAR